MHTHKRAGMQIHSNENKKRKIRNDFVKCMNQDFNSISICFTIYLNSSFDEIIRKTNTCHYVHDLTTFILVIALKQQFFNFINT
jgi:hypothetical protein